MKPEDYNHSQFLEETHDFNIMKPLPQSVVVDPDPNEFKTEADFGLIYRLLKKDARYKIPEQLRDKVITNISQMLDKPDCDDRVKISAMKVLAELDKINVDLVKTAMPKRSVAPDVRKLTDEQLQDALKEVVKLLETKEMKRLE